MASFREITPKRRRDLYEKAERYMAIRRFELEVIKITEERKAKRRCKR